MFVYTVLFITIFVFTGFLALCSTIKDMYIAKKCSECNRCFEEEEDNEQ